MFEQVFYVYDKVHSPTNPIEINSTKLRNRIILIINISKSCFIISVISIHNIQFFKNKI